ncbi:MAG: hypothetical protein WC175_06360 [Candidatus Dojkabacteria bacterium]
MKNKDWMIRYAKSVMNGIGSGEGYSKKELEYWNMYNSRVEGNEYSYLMSYGDFDLPVKVRFTSIVRPNIDYLVSRYLGNPFNFSVSTIDKKSLESKFRDKINQYVDSLTMDIDSKYDQMSLQIEEINNKEQELMTMLQQEPQNEEHAQQLAELQKSMPMIRLKINQMRKALEREIRRASEDISNLEILSKFKAKDVRQDFAYKKLKSMFEIDGIKEEHRKALVDKIVTGRPYIFVDIENNELVYKYLPSYSVYHPKSVSVPYVEDGDWVAYEEFHSYDYVMHKWGNSMTDKERKRLKAFKESYYREVYSQNEFNSGDYIEDNRGSVSTGNNIRVIKIYFQVSEKLSYKVSKDKHGNTHVHKHSDDDSKLRKNESVKRKYKTYAYQGVIIDSNIFVDFKLREHQLLKVDNYGWNQLPIIGDNYDEVSRHPNSIIRATKDLQALNRIIEYYKELLLVISGVKGFLMDKSQLPKGMGEKEWMYYRKLGVMWIQSYRQDRRTQTQFNQFQQYDDTISPGIQYLMALQDRIQAQVDQITGVNRHARGEMESRDPVGTSQMAIQATSIIADILFWEHDQVVRRSLTRAINLYCKFIGDKGDMFTIYDKLAGQYNPIKVPPGLLNGADYDAVVMNNNKDFRELESMRQLITSEYSRGNISMADMANLIDTDSISELRIIAENMVEKADEMRQLAFQNEQEAAKQLKEYDAQIQAQLNAPMNQLKEMEVKLKELDLELKNKQITFEEEYKQKALESENFLKALDIMSEREVELKYLDEQKESRQVDNILEQARILSDVALGKEKNDNERRKATMRPKERIKD